MTTKRKKGLSSKERQRRQNQSLNAKKDREEDKKKGRASWTAVEGYPK